MKVVTIVGARPQFIKAAIVSHTLKGYTALDEIIVHTGQHYDDNMSEVFFRELEMPAPAHNLEVGSASHGAQTGRMLEAIERIIFDEHPDLLLIYGDTNSTLAGAIAAAKLHIPVAHVEAGLRSFNKRMPEEINRILADHASDLLFAPTQQAVVNLRAEGIAESQIHNVGDVMYDAALHYGSPSRMEPRRDPLMQRLGVTPQNYILATVHRAENTDDTTRLTAIFEALMAVAPTCPIVLPLHPRTRKALTALGLFERVKETLNLVDPVGYLDMTALERNARVVVTDSGGVQKEAFFHRVPCVTLRDETEWVELVDVGWNTLTPPTNTTFITKAILSAAQNDHPPEPQQTLYGGGNACKRIAEILLTLVD